MVSYPRRGDHMKLKRYSIFVLLSGVLFSLAGALMPVIHCSTMGIIGGAGASTYKLALQSLFDGLPVVLILLGVSLILSAGFCLLFSKTVKAHCHLATSAISLGLAAVGGTGIGCVLLWFSIAAFHEMSRHPITYPVSIAVGMLCFGVFLFLIALYFGKRKENWSISGIVIDVLTSIVFLPTFFCCFQYLYEILRFS